MARRPVARGLALASLAALLASPCRAHPACAHEEHQRTTGGVRNSGYSFNRAVPYGDDGHFRRLSGSSWAPIRIKVDYSAGATTGLSSSLKSFLEDTLVPQAVLWIASALSVVPVSGNLKHVHSSFKKSSRIVPASRSVGGGSSRGGGSYSSRDDIGRHTISIDIFF